MALAKKAVKNLLDCKGIELMLIFIDFFEFEVGLGGSVHIGELCTLGKMLVVSVEMPAGSEELEGMGGGGSCGLDLVVLEDGDVWEEVIWSLEEI